jgi:hypothetical protein
MTSTDVRNFVVTNYIQPAQARGERTVSVIAGDIHKALQLKNRVPLVCTALRSRRFLVENHLRLKDVSGPPSGLSTTVKFTFELESGSPERGTEEQNPLLQLRGIAKHLFSKPGEWERLIRKERESFVDIADKLGQ